MCIRDRFYNPTVLAVTVSDKLTGQDLKDRIDTVNALQFERVGTQLGAQAIAVVNDSGTADAFAAAAEAVKQNGKLAVILVSDSPEAMAAAVAKTGGTPPLLAAAKLDTAEAMAKIAKENKCPLVAKAQSIDDLSLIHI